MQAVILAAGCGLRLRPMTEDTPKGLITVGSKTLLELSLDALAVQGIRETLIVCGHLQEKIERKIGSSYHGMAVRYIRNEKYASTGSMASFLCSRDKIRDKVILLESDLLYEPRAIDRLMKVHHNDCLLVAACSGSGDEVYICTDKDKRILDLGKNIPVEKKKKAIGELVGISRFGPKFLEQLFAFADGQMKSGKNDSHYEECVRDVSNSENPVYAEYMADLAWIEIDKEQDLMRAVSSVYPRIYGEKKD